MRHMKSIAIAASVMMLAFAGTAYADDNYVYDIEIGAEVLQADAIPSSGMAVVANYEDTDEMTSSEAENTIVDELEVKENEVVGSGLPEGLGDSIGNFKLTSYCTCRKCSGKYGAKTATGTTCTENQTIAVDPRVIPLGSWVYLNIPGEGWKKYHAEDTGGKIKGNRIDVYTGVVHANTRQQKYNTTVEVRWSAS
jgi:3D (Asp-Asp-Asp) domain-containing protein